MTVYAMSLLGFCSRECHAAKHIDLVRYRYEMVWPDAGMNSTLVINLAAIRNWSILKFICKNMCTNVTVLSWTKQAITFWIFGRRPNPAWTPRFIVGRKRAILLNLLPKSFIGSSCGMWRIPITRETTKTIGMSSHRSELLPAALTRLRGFSFVRGIPIANQRTKTIRVTGFRCKFFTAGFANACGRIVFGHVAS